MSKVKLNEILLTDLEVKRTRELIQMAAMAGAQTGNKKLEFAMNSLLDNFLIPIGDE